MPSDETKDGDALSSEELRGIDAYWRAANYLSVGQIYLYDNPLLKQPLGAYPASPDHAYCPWRSTTDKPKD